MQPRPYQLACAESVRKELCNHPSTLVEMATGTGKTVLFSHLAKDWPGRVMIIAHREELVRQAADKLLAITGERPGVEMADERVDEGSFARPKVVVASVQTLALAGRQGKFKPNEFGLLVIDEAHHAPASTYRKVIAHFRQHDGCKVLGVTATPKRADEVALGQVFESVAFRYGIEAAVDDGWLVPVVQQCVEVDGLDFSKVREVAGDFREGELEEILTQEEPLHEMAAPIVEMAKGRSTLVFCCTVKHAQLMAAVLERYQGSSVRWLSGATPREERARVVEAFRAGEVQFLCNCSLFLEGFDAPNTAVVAMARPTKSIVLYAQVLGRGTRPLPGIVDRHDTPQRRKAAIRASRKPSMLALDFVGNAGRHKIVTAADVLGGRYGIPVREYARKTVSEEKRPVAVEEALERAQAELDLLEEERERRRKIVARAHYRAREVSPFVGGAPVATVDKPAIGTATEGQIRYLCRLGVSESTARGYSKRQASAVIDKLLEKGEKRP